MIDRRALMATLASSSFAGSWPVAAQARVFRVGCASIGTDPAAPVRWQSFRDAMRELGYVEGRNLTIGEAFANGDAQRLPGLMGELFRSGVDVIVTSGIRETRAAREASSTLPIVMLAVPDPVAQGFVASLARPGGNVTGVTNMVPGLSQKFIELLHEAVPAAMRLAVVSGPSNPVAELRSELEAAARRYGIELQYVTVHGAVDIEPALRRAKGMGVEGIVATLDPVTLLHRRELVGSALKHRLAGIYWDRGFVEDGGLMTYSASLKDLFRRGAVFVDKILKGARPAELPVEQPTRFALVINLKTARALGLAIPQSLLLRADEVIE
ncbi:MAG: ABC transporter substrate-binding protein [Burkholderiaceae bacterium]